MIPGPLSYRDFRETGPCSVWFALQIVGTADVASARGDSMCAEAIKRLKVRRR